MMVGCASASKRKGVVYFGPMRFEAEAQPTIFVYAGPDTSCLSLSVRSDGHSPTKVAVDLAPEEGTEVTREELEPDLPLLGSDDAAGDDDGLDEFTWLLSREGSIDRDELVARAQRRANELSLRVSAEGELDGTIYGHVLLPGLPVVIDGAGEMLGGTYYVDWVTHKFTTDGYKQSMKLVRNAYGDAQG